MSKSKIEWTEHTWNPVVGCSKVTQGCKHCYAEQLFPRLRNRCGYGDKFTDVRLLENRLDKPLKRKKPTMYFVNSMSDLFHEDLSDSDIEQVFSVMEKAPQHTFQVLTKRAERLPVFFANRQVPDNVWIGVSVENVKQGKPRISLLREVQAKTRFLSIEPLLEDVGELDLQGIHWVIVGGESGPKARPMRPEWAENVRVQCEEQKVPFFFKQWGAWGADGVKRPKSGNGSKLNGKSYKEYPIPETTVSIPVHKPGVVHGTYRTYEEIEAALEQGDITKGTAAAHKSWLTRNSKRQDSKSKAEALLKGKKSSTVHGKYDTHEDIDAAVKRGELSKGSAASYKAWVTMRNGKAPAHKEKESPQLSEYIVRVDRIIPGANMWAFITMQASNEQEAIRKAEEVALKRSVTWRFEVTNNFLFKDNLSSQVTGVETDADDEAA